MFGNGVCPCHRFNKYRDRHKFGNCVLHLRKYLSHRYESTSSEEEDEDEDGSSSGESGEGECLDSTEEDDAALEEETSEEERNINLDESDTDEETLRAENYSSDAVKEK